MPPSDQFASDSPGAADAAPVPDLPLPRYVSRDGEGIYVELTAFEGSAAFSKLVERLLAAGYFFRGLDYAAFSALLFDESSDRDTPAKLAAATSTRLRWAHALARFDPARSRLYRDVQADGSQAVYLFEKVFLPVPRDTAGEESADAAEPTEVEAFLDVDEFIVQMWLKGVRAGLDIDAIREAIDHRQNGRRVIARALPAQAGTDATVRELWDGLRRDDAPQVLPDGRADLTQFRNRFPQVKAGVRLLEKVPPIPGTPGRSLSGELIEPAAPKDFDLEQLGGAGTAVEREDGRQILRATINGFVDIDAASNRISVSEKIIHRQGVSVRTTGDLALMGDEYEEFGEIQERRTVEGRSITTHADVFGRLVSSGGTIRVMRNLSGGSAHNRDGPVIVDGAAMNAWIHAPRGEIKVRRAENCVLSGDRVEVLEQACACVIFAREVQVADARGCVVGGRDVVIGQAAERAGRETLVQMLIPDSAYFSAEIDKCSTQIRELEGLCEAARARGMQLRAQPELAGYLNLATRLRKGALQLTEQQNGAFQALARKLAPLLKEMARIASAIEQAEGAITGCREAVERLEQERSQASEALHCRIQCLSGGVTVRTLPRPSDAPPLATMQAAELRQALNPVAVTGQVLCDAASGSFEWRLVGPVE